MHLGVQKDSLQHKAIKKACPWIIYVFFTDVGLHASAVSTKQSRLSDILRAP
jgi:hypothetical protein